MSDSNYSTQMMKAKAEIAASLRKLEESTGRTVLSVSLNTIDTTGMAGSVQSLAEVEIQMSRLPGKNL